jgi:hypothetical protein
MSPITQIAGLGRPDFLVDPGSADRNAGRKVDWSKVADTYRDTPGFNVTIGAGGAIAGATTVPVSALSAPLPAGSRLILTGANAGDIQFRTTAAAAAGAVSLSTEALPEAVTAADVYFFEGSGGKRLPHGEPVQEDPTTGLVHPAADAASGATSAVGLLEGPALENDLAAPLTGYGLVVGGVVWRDLVPHLTANKEAALKVNGTGFKFEDYDDSRAS